MKKIAIIGKPASGKSTLSKKLAAATGIKLHALDSILYQANGAEIERADYEAIHQDIIAAREWIIEGFGPMNSLHSFNKRLEAADTVIYIDLPYTTTYWLVTKRFLKGLFKKPEGWPEGSSIWHGTLQSYKVLKLCPKFWNAQFLQRLETLTSDKTLHVIRSVAQLDNFVATHVK
ncbi:adenylate kinase [Planctobacterium marinum]|uniref:Topology modulation protein n=1 Tax=Planctobacterium marinum TaxID=1631968 RepID=A0AA48KR15_9ALTE|nr:topology modulation protein [Planctobacterium marinum]